MSRTCIVKHTLAAKCKGSSFTIVALPREKVKARDDDDNRDVTFEFVSDMKHS